MLTTPELLAKIQQSPVLREQLRTLLATMELLEHTHYCIQCGINSQEWNGICMVCLDAGELDN